MKVLKNAWAYLRIKANENNYKEHDGQLKEQFVNGINDDHRNSKRVLKVQKTNYNMSEQVLSLAKRIKLQKAQNAMLTST